MKGVRVGGGRFVPPIFLVPNSCFLKAARKFEQVSKKSFFKNPAYILVHCTVSKFSSV